MGWQDREYARPGGTPVGPGRPVYGHGGYGRGSRSVVRTLIIINIVVFLVCLFTCRVRGDMTTSPLFMWTAMIPSQVAQGQLWRLMTSDFLHWDFWHILMNMVGLHFLGRPLEQVWGARRFLTVYLVAGVLSSIFYYLLTVVHWLAPGVAAGASGCVLALLGACAVLFPRAEVWIYFLFPVKIRTVAVVLGAAYAFNIYVGGHNAGGDACHFLGLLFGSWWAWRGQRWWDRTTWRLPRFFGGRRRGGGASGGSTFADSVEQRRADERLIDEILRKVHDGGIHTLTEAEKRLLMEATARQKKREGGEGRVDRL